MKGWEIDNIRRLIFVLVFILNIELVFGSIIINEVMYNPEGSDNNREFIELYSVPTNFTDYIISDGDSNDTLVLFYFNNNSNYSLIVEDDYLIETYNASIYKIGATIGNGLGEDDIIYLYYPNGTIADTASIDSSIANNNGYSMEYFNGSWYESSVINGTPGKENQPNTTISSEDLGGSSQDLTFTISINKEQLNIGDTLVITGNFSNTYNQSIDGALIIKIGKEKPDGGYEYPEDYILINQNITLNASSNTSLNDLFGNITWVVPSDAFSGNYKAYAPFSSNIKNRQPSKLFDVYGLGNVFIDSWEIDNYNLNLENNTLNASINLTNNETEVYSINLSIVVEDLKTVSDGKHDFEFFCENFSISNQTTELYTCTFMLPNNTITNGTQEFDIYSKIIFVYSNATITKKSDKKEINITGLEDLGEPVLEIISSGLTANFGEFTTVLVKYNTKNYNKPLRFITYAYSPKRVSEDLKGETIYQKFCELDTAIELQSLERGQTIYLSLPLFLKKNCDDDYSTGIYESFARVCEFKDEWDYMSPTDNYKKGFDLLISGSNNINCPTEKYLSTGGSTKTASGFIESTGAAQQSIKIFNYDKTRFKLVFPDEISTDKEFFVDFEINNTFSEQKTFSIWSYVYKGRTALMEREQNMVNVTLKPNEMLKFQLKNIISKGDITPDGYKLMVKIKSSTLVSTKSIQSDVNLIIGKSKRAAEIVDFRAVNKYSDKVEMQATIKANSYAKFDLVLDSIYDSQEKELNLKAGEESEYDFEEVVGPGKNMLFLKLLSNNELVDVKELLVFVNGTEVSSFSKKDPLFNNLQRFRQGDLMTGSSVLNQTEKTVYLSSSAKARELAALFMIVLFAYLAVMLIWKKL